MYPVLNINDMKGTIIVCKLVLRYIADVFSTTIEILTLIQRHISKRINKKAKIHIIYAAIFKYILASSPYLKF